MENQAQDTNERGSLANAKDELDGVIAKGIKDDPFLRFLYMHRTAVIVTVLGALFAYYAYVRLEESHTLRMRHASEVYSELRKAYASYEENANEESKDLLLQKVTVLQAEKEPYKTMAESYQALVASKESDWKEARAFLEAKNLETYPKEATERLYLETALLGVAKQLLASAEDRAFALSYIEGLVRHAEYVHAAAYKTVASSNTLDEQTLSNLKQAIVAKHPESASLVE